MSQPRTLPCPPTLAPYQQEQAATLIKSVRARLLADDPDIAADPDLWRDTLDGESDAIDLIRNLIRASIEADLMAESARKRQAEIAGRAERAERRKQAFRAAAFALMDIAGITRLPEPDFLARIQAGQPQLADLNVDALPSDYVETEMTVTRRPLKDRILADLRAGLTIPGAELLRALPFLVVHRK
jgi:Siphovirus Gp157